MCPAPDDQPGVGADAVSRVTAVMEATPRIAFLPGSQRRSAELDLALPIGHGQTCSQPSTVRRMLELLDVRPGHRVLDVGAGSGWTTALLAGLVGPQGRVTGVEIEPDLVTIARANVGAADRPWARVETAAPGRLGWPADAPYDRVLVSADGGRVPDELVTQLAPTGVMVLPVGGRLVRLRMQPGHDPVREEHGHYLFVPLR